MLTTTYWIENIDKNKFVIREIVNNDTDNDSTYNDNEKETCKILLMVRLI